MQRRRSNAAPLFRPIEGALEASSVEGHMGYGALAQTKRS